jgi:hypothetical protein
MRLISTSTDAQKDDLEWKRKRDELGIAQRFQESSIAREARMLDEEKRALELQLERERTRMRQDLDRRIQGLMRELEKATEEQLEISKLFGLCVLEDKEVVAAHAMTSTRGPIEAWMNWMKNPKHERVAAQERLVFETGGVKYAVYISATFVGYNVLMPDPVVSPFEIAIDGGQLSGFRSAAMNWTDAHAEFTRARMLIIDLHGAPLSYDKFDPKTGKVDIGLKPAKRFDDRAVGVRGLR